MSSLRRPTLAHLYHFVQQIQRHTQQHKTLTHLLTQSSHFLSSYLPPRLHHYHHTHHYHHYSHLITELPSFTPLSAVCHRLSRSQEWQGRQDIQHFAVWSQQVMQEMEEAVTALTNELRELMRSSSSHQRPVLQREVNTLLDSTYSLLIEMRLQISHHAYAHAVWEQSLSRTLSVEDARKISLSYPVVSRCDVLDLTHRSVQTAKSICTSKYGDAPSVEIEDKSQQQPLSMLAVDSHIHFILVELLKNSMKAVIEEVGVRHLYAAPPVKVVITASPPAAIGFILSDNGVGLAALSKQHSFLSPAPASLYDYFSSLPPHTSVSSVSEEEEGAHWRYSRLYGQVYSGLGVGLSLCRLYCSQIYGGGITVCWVPSLTQALVVLNQIGRGATSSGTM